MIKKGKIHICLVQPTLCAPAECTMHARNYTLYALIWVIKGKGWIVKINVTFLFLGGFMALVWRISKQHIF